LTLCPRGLAAGSALYGVRRGHPGQLVAARSTMVVHVRCGGVLVRWRRGEHVVKLVVGTSRRWHAGLLLAALIIDVRHVSVDSPRLGAPGAEHSVRWLTVTLTRRCRHRRRAHRTAAAHCLAVAVGRKPGELPDRCPAGPAQSAEVLLRGVGPAGVPSAAETAVHRERNLGALIVAKDVAERVARRIIALLAPRSW